MLYKLFKTILVIKVVICSENILRTQIKFSNITKLANFTFKDFVEKFDARHVWRRIDKRNKERGLNRTVTDELDEMYKGMDETDELLKLKVKNGEPTIKMHADGRRQWRPSGYYGPSRFDYYNLKPRFLELMKQTIYQTRSKMIIMQTLRNKYRRNSLFKMGFLTSKADTACKNFGKFAYKAFRDCSASRQNSLLRVPLIELLMSGERLINLWFDVDLLVDLVIKNDENCIRMLNEVMTNRKYAWKFYD